VEQLAQFVPALRAEDYTATNEQHKSTIRYHFSNISIRPLPHNILLSGKDYFITVLQGVYVKATYPD